jgi:hypothetical protein
VVVACDELGLVMLRYGVDDAVDSSQPCPEAYIGCRNRSMRVQGDYTRAFQVGIDIQRFLLTLVFLYLPVNL